MFSELLNHGKFKSWDGHVEYFQLLNLGKFDVDALASNEETLSDSFGSRVWKCSECELWFDVVWQLDFNS